MRKIPIILIISLFVISCREYVLYPFPDAGSQVTAVRIIAEEAYDVRKGDPSALEEAAAEVIYSDGSTSQKSILSLLQGESVIGESGVKDAVLCIGNAETEVELFVYDVTLDEMQDEMTAIGAEIQTGEAAYNAIRSYCLENKYVLVEEKNLQDGPLTAVESILALDAFMDNYFRGEAAFENVLFTGGIQEWDSMADIEADGITIDRINATLTALNGSKDVSEIYGISISGDNASVLNSSIGNVNDDDSKTFWGIYVGKDGSKPEETLISNTKITGYDAAIGIESGNVEITDITFDGIIAIKITNENQFSGISLSGCTSLNDRAAVLHDVIVVGPDEAVGEENETADAWFEAMKEANPGLTFGSAPSIELGGAEIKDWEIVDGGDVEATM